MRSAAIGILLAATLISLAKPALASEAAHAKQLYTDAQSEYDLGHFETALQKYEEAFKLSHKAALLFNIAQCHRQMKNFEMAATTYRSFIRLEPTSKQVALAEKLLSQVEEALRTSQSTATAPPLEVIGQKPEKPADDAPPPIEATTPPPVIVAVAPLDRPKPQPKAVEPAAVSAPAETAAPAKKSRTFTWIAAGGAGLALGGGALFGLQSKSTASQITAGGHDRATLDSLRTQQQSQASKANLLLGAGAGLAALTAALFVLEF